ncbi:SDR family NAD(P)-dependent oxidoreductase [Leucothrix sargassi]|nr:SDR family NAD(P)-dependent oxidoreductase [Leucothrix sargassi]
MSKVVLVTGSTDGIGLETAKELAQQDHTVLLHGRSDEKLADAKAKILAVNESATVDTFKADLSRFGDVEDFAAAVSEKYSKIDALINNAGVYVVPNTTTADQLDMRFMVNTIAPYLLTKCLLPLLSDGGRVVNLSSAAQAPISPDEIGQPCTLSDDQAYAKSKLGITMWTRQLALSLGKDGPVIVAVNPASLLGSKMVNETYGIAGKDIRIGADVLVRAALSDEFADASGRYFDNDISQFAQPHPHALDAEKIAAITDAIEDVIARFS